MAMSLEEYVSQANNAYQPATNAIHSQLSNLEGQYQTAQDRIANSYAQQEATINNQRNQAAEAASLAAAGNGGAFGGAGNIARRKYYEQTFVPAVTQMQTNRSNDLLTAQQNYENSKTNLNSQLANLNSQAHQQALAQYYADLTAERQRQYEMEEAEKARQWQAEQAELNRQASLKQAQTQNAYYDYLMKQMNSQNNSGNSYTLASMRNQYGGYDWTDAQGNPHRASTVAASAAGSNAGNNFNQSLFDILSLAAEQGDYYSQLVADELNQGVRFAKNTGGATGNAIYDTLGIYRVN